MQILITGGAGFIGTHLVDRLLLNGHAVTVIDNESTGIRSNVAEDAIYYQMDVRDQKIDDVFAQVKPEVVVHLAAQSVVPVSIREPQLDAEINLIGLLNVLEAARRHGTRKIIYSSSAAVYGEPASFPIREEQAGQLLSPYAVSKFAGEKYLAAYQHLYGLAFTVFRFANVYGPRQLPKSDGGVIAIFADAIQKGLPLTINGDGEQTRDFIYVADVAEAIEVAFTKADNTVLNLSTGLPTSINELIDELVRLSGRPVERHHAPNRPGDIRFSYLCNEKMAEQLEWTPRFSLRAGLELTWNAIKG
ncbi:NAD-dependent epimerase/dehydratase family protein [Brevibacillus massiliensis]|jgi:UDP-glucose 4-epimerase|uniref:NAD-dependent epimerase/dehydratase family protein n=1 Tax=Brevibacillus massiliensis TaxID=1118054 RepID=UPI00031EEE40|nr:NAD-dependent epimerase/dehydratase family protein [Brevibacillus massiliensis]